MRGSVPTGALAPFRTERLRRWGSTAGRRTGVPHRAEAHRLPDSRGGTAPETTFQLFVETDMTGPNTRPSATITRMAHTLTNINSVYGI